MPATPAPTNRIHAHATETTTTRRANALLARYGHLHGADLLAPLIRDEFAGRIAVTSSFGSEAAALLALVAEVEPATPVLFVDTGRLFGQTHRYREQVTTALGLADVRVVSADAEQTRRVDADEDLWRHDADACCEVRKVRPLAAALAGFDAWITGRKRFHGEERSHLPLIEAAGARVRVNPLAGFEKADIEAVFARYGLPRHPLEAEGYRSIGCMPCTARVAPGACLRSGRWPGQAKTECGIHRLC